MPIKPPDHAIQNNPITIYDDIILYSNFDQPVNIIRTKKAIIKLYAYGIIIISEVIGAIINDVMLSENPMIDKTYLVRLKLSSNNKVKKRKPKNSEL